MGKWINKSINPTTDEKSDHHIAVEDLARLADGTVEPPERQRLIGHLNRCQRCYQILQETIADVADATFLGSASLPWWRTRMAYALAASIFLVLIIGGSIAVRQFTKSPSVILATLPLDRTLKDILLQNDALRWEKKARVNRLLAALQQRGVPVKKLDRVLLSKPYYQKKSLFGPEEVLHIRIENRVAYLEVKEKRNFQVVPKFHSSR